MVSLFVAVGTAWTASAQTEAAPAAAGLRIQHDEEAGTIEVFLRNGPDEPLITQHARAGDRPYIHPILAPDGNGVLTQYRPEHHPHQTGLYWGLKELNGRDYFMQWQDDHYRRVSAHVVRERGPQVRWQTVYDLLDGDGSAILTETQNWTMRVLDEGRPGSPEPAGGVVVLDLEWTGEALTDITLGQFYVGGLFLRMPWDAETDGDVVNASGQRNGEAEQQRAIWTDIGLEIEGRSDYGHIAMFDHPDNEAFPAPWRIDNELGIGPSRQILGDWHLATGERTTTRYRLLVYTGDRDPTELTRLWTEFAAGR